MDNDKTLVICDSEPVAVEGIRSLLHQGGDFSVVADESSLSAGMEAVSLLQPALVLIDKAFGLQPVTEWVRKLRADARGASSIVWGGNLSEAEGLRFMQAGARGVLRKTAPLYLVRECIRAVAAGGTWMEDALLQPDTGATACGPRSALTLRERQIVELVEQGLKNKEIAGALGICTGTVKIHLKHIFEKTGIRGRYGLALNGLKEKGLLAMPVGQAV